MPETPLDSAGPLAQYNQRLKALGYRSVEQFIGAAHAAGDALGAYLNTDITALVNSLPSQHAPLVAAARQYSLQPKRFALGGRLRHIRPAQPPLEPPGGVMLLPSQINMVAQMPPIKDQGQRGTCVAFASLAVVERAALAQRNYQDLAEQFLYWDCKANDGYPDEDDTWLSVSFPLLQRDGCCLETTWPYNPNIIAGDVGQGPPPAGASAEALSYKVATINALAATSVQTIKSELARGFCVAFLIPVFGSWYLNFQVTQSGNITLPIPNEQPNGGHAMCLVGYADDTANPALGGGSFILRNSWGDQWGAACAYGAGYGTIPYAYLASYAEEAYCSAPPSYSLPGLHTPEAPANLRAAG